MQQFDAGDLCEIGIVGKIIVNDDVSLKVMMNSLTKTTITTTKTRITSLINRCRSFYFNYLLKKEKRKTI